MISQLNQSPLVRFVAAAIFFLFIATPVQPLHAQPYEPDDEIDQTVARVSFIQGAVSYGRGDDPDDWDPALLNVPFTLGDRLYSSDGRAELQLPGGNFIRIGRRSYLTALTLTYDTKQFYLGNGAATINLRRLDSDDVFEIDTPNVAVTLDRPGRYRIEVDENGDTRVIARSGRAIVAANGREVTVERAEMRIYGIDRPEYEIAGLRGAGDAFDRWVDEREDRFERRYRAAYQYADEEIVGVDDLADYGRWEEIPEYGQAWTPTQVAVGWQPFTVGHWFWQDPWGWTWISEEPWGWAPCHYGRWTFYRSRWYWVPVRRRVEVVRYAPAVVEIVHFRDHVGWFPLHPRDRFVPWWGRRGRVEEVTYVNRTRVVIVNETTFISSRRVTTSIVRDTTIIRESTTVRTRERLPIPRRESIRVVAERREVQRPPATIVSRPVVVRVAPTPPPPKFEDKLRVIRERGGPLTTKETVELGAKDFKSNRRIQLKPAAAGRGEFVGRGQGASAPPTQPLTSTKGRKLATQDEPVVTDLPRKQQRDEQRKERQAQDQQRKESNQDNRDLERKQQEQERLKKEQERDRQKDQKELQEQQKKDQERDRRDLERKRQDEERLKKQQESDREKNQKQLQEQQKKDQERERQKQVDLERRKNEEQKQRDEQLRKEQERKQDQERRKQLQDEQQKQRQIQQDQKQQEQDRRKQLQDDQKKQQQLDQEQRREELERRRLEKKPQDEQKEPEKQGRGTDRQREQDLREAARQRQLQERKPAPRRDQPPPDETPRGRGDRDAPPPAGPPPPGPPPR